MPSTATFTGANSMRLSSQDFTRNSGYSMVELMLVLGIAGILAVMAVPVALNAMSKAAVGLAADEVLRVAAQAQVLARSQVDTGDGQAYGIAIVQDAAGTRATLLLGSDADDELTIDGRPVLSVALSEGVRILVAREDDPQAPLAGRICWFFRPGDGVPVVDPADPRPIPIGTIAQTARGRDYVGNTGGNINIDYRVFESALPAIPASPVASAIQVQSRDGRHGIGLEWYQIGLAAKRPVAAGP